MRRMFDKQGTTPTPTGNYVTLDTEQTIEADKTISANLYKAETGYELTPYNTGLTNGATGTRTQTLGSKIKVYFNNDNGGQQNEYFDMYEEDYFILRYDNSTSKYEFKVQAVTSNMYWYLMDTSDNTVAQSGTLPTTPGIITCNPGQGDYKLWFSNNTYVYSWSSDSDETYRYITVQERGTKMYHHHIRVNQDEDYTYWIDVLSTHPESFTGEDWAYLAEARCIGVATMYAVDEDLQLQKCYTICGYDISTPYELHYIQPDDGHVATMMVETTIPYDEVTI